MSTVEDPEWSRRYLSSDPREKAYGGRVEIVLSNGTTIVDEIALPDAHPLGARPFAREQYVAKFRTLANDVLEDEEIERFLGAAQRLPALTANEFTELNFSAKPGLLASVPEPEGLF